MPRDHLATGGPSWDLTYAIQRATGTRLGTFVTITGGPGTSGIASADSYTDAFDPAIAEHYDIVFLDQRGVGLSHPITCPSATAVYYASTADPADPAQRDAVGRAASTYVTDCLEEARAGPGRPALLRHDARPSRTSRRSVEYLGADKLDLYGESYGTQYVQTYAAAHPDRIKALFIDGPVDLAPGAIAYYTEGARAFDDVLVSTLAECRRSAACRSDTQGGDALAAYDALAARLATRPAHVPLPDRQRLVHRPSADRRPTSPTRRPVTPTARSTAPSSCVT